MQTNLALIFRCRLTHSHIFFVLGMMLLLTACGGGGGGSSGATNLGPSNVQVVGGDGAVTLTWNPVSGVTAYNIYLAKQAGVTKSNYLTLNGGEKRTVLTSPAIVGALANGTTYFLVVTSINAESKESDSSAEVSTTPLPAPPLVPQNVQAQPGDKRVTLSWDNMSGANSYNVYYGTQSGVTKFNGIKLSNQNNPALISNLTNGVTYYFVVTSSNTTYSQESSDSGVAHATPASLLGDTAPLTGSATSVTDTSANLNGSFTNPPGFTTTVSFEYGSTSSYGNSTASDVYLQSGSISYSKAVTTISPMTTLHYRLVTQNSGGTFYGQDQQFTTSAAPTTLLSDLDAPVGMPFDGSYVYWMEVYSGRVRRLNVTNDTTSTIASNMAFGGNSGGIAIDGTYIYLTDGWGAIRRMNLDGSNLQNNFSAAAMSSPTQIVAHSTGLYIREDWCDTTNMLWHQTISRISLDGLTRTQLYERPGNVPGIPGVGGCGGSGFGGGMVLDNNYLYWTDYYYGNIQRLPLSGGTPVIVATSLFYPDQLLLNGTMLYVSHANGISKIDLSMGTMTSVISTTSVSGGSMVKDGTNLYVLTPTRVSKLDLNTNVTISSSIADQGYTSVPVVTSNHLYWITAGNHYYPPLGALKQIMKP